MKDSESSRNELQSSLQRIRINSNNHKRISSGRRGYKKESSGLDGLAALQMKQPSYSEDICSLFRLAIPIIFTMMPWVFMKTTETVIAGHLGTTFLTALAMSELWTSVTGVGLNGSVLGGFVAKAIAAGEPGFAGEWLQVSLVVVGFASLFVAGAWVLTSDVLENGFGVDKDLARKAQYYSLVSIIAIPSRIILSHLTQYYQAQQHSGPSVISGLLATIVNLVVSLIVVLGYPFNGQGEGWKAAPVIPVASSYFQLLVMWLLAPRINDEWPGWSISHITKHRVVEFSRLYFPSAFSSASDWWRVAVIGVFASSCRQHTLATFHATYRLLWISLIMTGAVSAATGIRLSIALSTGDSQHAKTLTILGIGLALPIIALLAGSYFLFPRAFAHLFTNSDQLIDEFVSIRYMFTVVVFLMNLQVVLERIPLSMNRSKLVSTIGLLSSWLIQVPAVIILTHFWRKDLVGVYAGVALGYAFNDLVLVGIILTSDYEKCSKAAMERALGHLVSDTIPKTSSGKYDSGKYRGPVGELERIASMDGSNHRTLLVPPPPPPPSYADDLIVSDSDTFEEAFLSSAEAQQVNNNNHVSGDHDNVSGGGYVPPTPYLMKTTTRISHTSSSSTGRSSGKISIHDNDNQSENNVTIDDEGKLTSSLKKANSIKRFDDNHHVGFDPNIPNLAVSF